MLKDFKEFAMRGNVLDMAVGIILGVAFGKIVSSFVSDILMPPIGLMLGRVDFANMFIALSGQSYAKPSEAKAAGAVTINYGLFLNTIIDFLIVAFVVFLLIRQVNRMKQKEEAPSAEPITKECPFCVSMIPMKASRWRVSIQFPIFPVPPLQQLRLVAFMGRKMNSAVKHITYAGVNLCTHLPTLFEVEFFRTLPSLLLHGTKPRFRKSLETLFPTPGIFWNSFKISSLVLMKGFMQIDIFKVLTEAFCSLQLRQPLNDGFFLLRHQLRKTCRHGVLQSK